MISDPSALTSGFTTRWTSVAFTNAAGGTLILPADPYRIYLGFQFRTTVSSVLWPDVGLEAAAWQFSHLGTREWWMQDHGGITQCAWYARDNGPSGVANIVQVLFVPSQLGFPPLNSNE